MIDCRALVAGFWPPCDITSLGILRSRHRCFDYADLISGPLNFHSVDFKAIAAMDERARAPHHLDIPLAACSVHLDGVPMVEKGDVISEGQRIGASK